MNNIKIPTNCLKVNWLPRNRIDNNVLQSSIEAKAICAVLASNFSNPLKNRMLPKACDATMSSAMNHTAESPWIVTPPTSGLTRTASSPAPVVNSTAWVAAETRALLLSNFTAIPKTARETIAKTVKRSQLIDFYYTY